MGSAKPGSASRYFQNEPHRDARSAPRGNLGERAQVSVSKLTYWWACSPANTPATRSGRIARAGAGLLARISDWLGDLSFVGLALRVIGANNLVFRCDSKRN